MEHFVANIKIYIYMEEEESQRLKDYVNETVTEYCDKDDFVDHEGVYVEDDGSLLIEIPCYDPNPYPQYLDSGTMEDHSEGVVEEIKDRLINAHRIDKELFDPSIDLVDTSNDRDI